MGPATAGTFIRAGRELCLGGVRVIALPCHEPHQLREGPLFPLHGSTPPALTGSPLGMRFPVNLRFAADGAGLRLLSVVCRSRLLAALPARYARRRMRFRRKRASKRPSESKEQALPRSIRACFPKTHRPPRLSHAHARDDPGERNWQSIWLACWDVPGRRKRRRPENRMRGIAPISRKAMRHIRVDLAHFPLPATDGVFDVVASRTHAQRNGGLGRPRAHR